MTTKQNAEQAPAKQVDVTLGKDVEFGGKPYKKGETLSCSLEQRTIFEAMGLIEAPEVKQ